jgi:hypothetical protein
MLLEASDDNLYIIKEASSTQAQQQKRTSGWRRYIAALVLLGTMVSDIKKLAEEAWAPIKV